MMSEKTKSALQRFELLIAVVMFFVMLISCGLYIDIKLNGVTSNLPMLSENDTKMILRSAASEKMSYSDDLLEPVFIGIKDGASMVAVSPSDALRLYVQDSVNETVTAVFSGTSKRISFESEKELEVYLESKKYSADYMLITFYSDLPSSIVLPCLQDNYRIGNKEDVFFFKYLFLLPDKSGNVYACAVSQDYTVYELYHENQISFNKIAGESYDISDGWVGFTYLDNEPLSPAFSNSVFTKQYSVNSYAKLYGKDKSSDWIDDVFDVFSFNKNLVNSFSSADGKEINFVEESGELVVNDDGRVVYKAFESGGISLNNHLGYISEGDSGISFGDKIFALKRIINMLKSSDDGVSYSVTGIDYDIDSDTLRVYFKYLSDGVFVFESPYDAVFEIKQNSLVYASFMLVKASGASVSESVLYPQKYASVASMADGYGHETYLFMSEVDTDGKRSVYWAGSSIFTEVDE